MRSLRHPAWRRRRRHGPPPFVRGVGCAFAALIGLAGLGGVTLVSGLRSQPEHALPIAVLAVVIVATLVGGFARVIGRVARSFAEANRRRRQLMADVAHELRTPLSILQGRVEGLLDGVYPRDDAHLNELLEEIRHLSRLVEDLRSIANAEAGALELRKELVDIGELIRDAAAALPRPIEVAIEGELPRLEIDPTRIREVLLNLLSNASRHTPAEGTVAVHAASRRGSVVVRVVDTGTGIPPEELPYVFERFQKGRDSKGSGLGLAIARNLVVAHGGEIGVESVGGKGTTVTFSLPA